jgi:hypothetical protein
MFFVPVATTSSMTGNKMLSSEFFGTSFGSDVSCGAMAILSQQGIFFMRCWC